MTNNNFLTLTLMALLIVVASTSQPQTVLARSLWSKSAPGNFLISDANATKVGDILTIVIQEDHRATDTADGAASRKKSVNGALSMLWNNPFMQKIFGGVENAPQVGFQSTNSFEGNAEVDRSSQFSSRIAATIVRVDQVGNYLLEARRTIRIGQEHKTIILSGKVRPRDIVNNSIFSYQVADAEISYLGDGTLSKKANPTFLHKIFDFLF